MKHYAFVSVIFGGNMYVPGAIVLAESIKIKNKLSNIDIVCLITSDISNNAKKDLEKVFNRVIRIDYITKETTPLYSEKQKKRYNTFANKLFTKWRCLTLVEYKKIIFLDADMVILGDITSLFELPTPAAPFQWIDIKEDKYRHTNNTYIKYKHGEQIPIDYVRNQLYNIKASHVLNGELVLISPQVGDMERFLEFINTKQVYGHSNCINTMDSQSIVDFYLNINKSFTQISRIYSNIPWYIDSPTNYKVLHYYGIKPWSTPKDKWPDLHIWWKFADVVYLKYNIDIDQKYFKIIE